MSTKQIGPIQFQGKLGTIVGRTTRKGYMSLGIKAAKVNNPQTPKQVVQRVKFGAAQNLANSIPAEILVGFTRYAKTNRMSLRNAVTRAYTKGISSAINNEINPKEAFTLAGDGGMGTTTATLDPEKMAFSTGVNQYYAGNASATGDVPGQIKVQLASQETILGNKDYMHHIIVFVPSANQYFHTTAQKSQENVIINMPTSLTGERAYVYAYAQYNEFGDTSVDYTQYPTASQAERAAIDSASSFTKTYGYGPVNIG